MKKALSEEQKKAKAQRLLRINGMFFLAAMPGYIACAFLHMCMAGHMKHPPYTLWHYGLDGSWMLFLMSSMVISIAAKSANREYYVGGSLLLFLTRFFIPGMLVGIALIIQAPIVIVLTFNAMYHVFSLKRPDSLGDDFPKTGDPPKE